MKTVLLTLLAFGSAMNTFAQGTVNFANVGVGLNAPIFLSDMTTKVPSSGFTAELLASDSSATLASVATTGFLPSAPGYFNGGPVTIASVAPGAFGFFEVRVFATASGSFAAAQAANLPNTWGQSPVFQVVTGGVGSPPTPPATLTTLPAFSLIFLPEPSVLALVALGSASLLIRRRSS